jgi:hypothetical protein
MVFSISQFYFCFGFGKDLNLMGSIMAAVVATGSKNRPKEIATIL